MPELEDQIQQLRRRAQDARQQQARAEAARDSAQQAVAQLTSLLQAEFGVETAQDAEALLVSLDAEMELEFRKVEAALAAGQNR